jgi:hypothetical protein
MKTHLLINNHVCKWNIDSLNLPEIELHYAPNIEDFLKLDGRKIAVFHAQFPYDLEQHNEFDNTVSTLLPHCENIIVLISEVHCPIVDFVHRFQDPKMKYFICGFLNDIEVAQWIDWFSSTRLFYLLNPVLDQLTPYAVKPKYFDILLGQPKPHRDSVYKFINGHQYNDRVVMTYMINYHHSKTIKEQGDRAFLWDIDDLEVDSYDFKWTVTDVKWHGQRICLSQIIPINIYNQTAYTVVCETNIVNHYSFFTEKTAKPILGRRLFLMYSGQYFLRNLRRLGFQTFNGIIDESYDIEPDQNTRWTMVHEQIRYLLNQPQEVILEKVRPIAEHNYRVMMETDWAGNLQAGLKELLIP